MRVTVGIAVGQIHAGRFFEKDLNDFPCLEQDRALRFGESSTQTSIPFRHDVIQSQLAMVLRQVFTQ
jgi:hypothetical protein